MGLHSSVRPGITLPLPRGRGRDFCCVGSARCSILRAPSHLPISFATQTRGCRPGTSLSAAVCDSRWRQVCWTDRIATVYAKRTCMCAGAQAVLTCSSRTLPLHGSHVKRPACGPSWRNRRWKGGVDLCGYFKHSSGLPAALLRGHSSVGRALESHSRGPGFESPWLHTLPPPAPSVFGTARGICIGPCTAANRLCGIAWCRFWEGAFRPYLADCSWPLVRIRSLRSPRCDVVGRVRHGAAQEGPLQPPVSRGDSGPPIVEPGGARCRPGAAVLEAILLSPATWVMNAGLHK